MTSNSSPSMSRRDLLIGATAAGTLCAVAPCVRAASEDSQGLAALAAKKGILFGASFAVHELDREYGAQYRDLYLRDARILTSELEFKLSMLRPDAQSLDFFGSDKLVEFATQNNMAVRAHTLI